MLLTEEFFKQNPDKVLGEARMAKDQYGKEIMEVRGTMDDIEAIDVPDVLVPTMEGDPVTSSINSSVDSVLQNPEYKKNIDQAVAHKEKREAGKVVRSRSKKAKKRDSGLDEINQEMFSFDEIVEMYNPGITEDEIRVWVWYQRNHGKPMLGQWKKYDQGTTIGWIAEMLGKGYLCWDTDKYVPAPLYYSGNIAQKMSDLLQNKASFKKVPKGDAQWSRQKDHLEEIHPHRLTLSVGDPADRLIILPISAIAGDFKVTELNDGSKMENPVSLRSAFLKYLRTIPESDFELPVSASEIEYRYIMNESDRSRRVSKEEKFETKKNARIEGDRLFSRFVYEEITPQDRTRLEQYWNSRYNSWVDVDYDKIPVGFECGKTFKRGDLKIRPAQREGVAFVTATGSGIVAYDVGVGKTMTAILAVGQAMQAGICSRPVIIVPNPTYDKWIAEIHGVWVNGRLIGGGILPQYDINDFKNLGSGYIDKLFDAKGHLKPIPENSITVLTYEALYKIGFNEDTHKDFVARMMTILDDGSDSSKARDMALQEQKAETTLGKVQEGTMIDFDDLGFDYVTIDEGHNFKNVFTNVKGEEHEGSRQYEIQGSVSTRGLKAFFITQFINSRYGGNSVLLTATPFTNNPLEVFSMLALVAYDALKGRGIGSLREFFDTYVHQTYEVVYGSDFQFREKAVIKQWNNRISLQQLIFSYINYKSGDDAGIQRPNKIVLPMFRANVNGSYVELPDDQQISTFVKPTEEQAGYLKDIEAFVLKETSLPDIASFCNFDAREDACTPDDRYRVLSNLSPEEADAGRALRGLSFARAVTLSPYLYVLNCRCQEDKQKKNYHKMLVESSPKLTYVMGCVASVKAWHEKRDEPVSGQIIYMDAGKDLFRFLKDYLVQEIGYNSKEVELIYSGVSQARKEKIKDGFLAGDVKIIIGTSTIKEGIDLQNKTSVLYNLWLDWRPTDVKQLEGRAYRFGNQFANVRIVTPLMENSIDPFMFQKLEEKTARINDIFDRHGKKNVLNVEEFNPEELKVGLITDPVKRAREEIRMETKQLDVEMRKLDSKIEGVGEINSLKSSMDYLSKKIISEEKYRFDFFVRHNSPYQESYFVKDKESGDQVEKFRDKDVRDELKIMNIASADDIVSMDQAIDFARLYERVTGQDEWGWEASRYRDMKKKLRNFEKSILKPRGMSLSDDTQSIEESLKNERGLIEDRINEMKSDKNMQRRIDEITEEMKALEKKRKSIKGRIDDFASMNDEMLSQMMDYSGMQKEKVREYKAKKSDDLEKKKKIARAKAAKLKLKAKILKMKYAS